MGSQESSSRIQVTSCTTELYELNYFEVSIIIMLIITYHCLTFRNSQASGVSWQTFLKFLRERFQLTVQLLKCIHVGANEGLSLNNFGEASYFFWQQNDIAVAVSGETEVAENIKSAVKTDKGYWD